MSKIDKQTLKILPRTKISIYKFVNQNTYFCRFFVGRKYFKSGRFEKTCKTRNINEAIVKANQVVEVNMPELSAGVYFVRFYSNDALTSKRIVISE